jgi:hypothetical protein
MCLDSFKKIFYNTAAAKNFAAAQVYTLRKKTEDKHLSAEMIYSPITSFRRELHKEYIEMRTIQFLLHYYMLNHHECQVETTNLYNHLSSCKIITLHTMNRQVDITYRSIHQRLLQLESEFA